LAIQTFGQIDILVLNAGVSMWTNFTEIEDLHVIKKLMNVNYHGAVNGIQTALPSLQKTKGLIVSISTLQAMIGFPKHSGYSASKHALKGFIDSLELEMNASIRFLDVFLGWIRGTNLRENAFASDGNPLGEQKKKHNKESISVEDCVTGIIKAIQSDKRQTFLPWKLGLIPFLQLFFPRYLNRKLSKAVREQK
jgi:short-subunit dehydrogenase